ncbi:MAG: DciA family protein [Gallionella sp.]
MTQRLKSLLSSAPELRPLLTKAQALSDLQSHVNAVAPPHLVQTAQVLGLQLGTLSIAVANSTIAAKLRQLAPELVVRLQNRGCEVSGIRVKVQVSFDRGQPKPVSRKLGKTAMSALNEFSQSLADSPLKTALDKLSRCKKG